MLTILLLCLAYLEGRLNQALSGSVTQEHPLNSLPGLQSEPQALDETEPYSLIFTHLHLQGFTAHWKRAQPMKHHSLYLGPNSGLL